LGAFLPSLTRLVLVLLLAGCAGSAPSTAVPATPTPVTIGCRTGAPEAGVHNPDRLQVLDPCKHATGVVVDVAHEDDGDYHVWFKVDPGLEYLLNPENHFQARPALLAEITPDCPEATNPPDAQSAARCPKSTLPIPAIGDHIAIDGPWVLDTDHGWREIHPVDSIRILPRA
jgi:hypothetical protein